MSQCKAISKRSGERCKRHAAKGRKVCASHGGKTPRGLDSPHFKTGRYSRSLPDQLAETYREALAEEELMCLNDEIALIDALIQDQLERLHQESEEPIAWGQVMGLVEQRRKLVDTERKRLMDEDRAIPIERLMVLVAAIVDIIRRHVASREERRAISNEIRGLVGDGSSPSGSGSREPSASPGQERTQ